MPIQLWKHYYLWWLPGWLHAGRLSGRRSCRTKASICTQQAQGKFWISQSVSNKNVDFFMWKSLFTSLRFPNSAARMQLGADKISFSDLRNNVVNCWLHECLGPRFARNTPNEHPDTKRFTQVYKIYHETCDWYVKFKLRIKYYIFDNKSVQMNGYVDRYNETSTS